MAIILSVNIVLNFIVSCFLLQTIFFSELYPTETRKLVERLINYVIYKVSVDFDVLLLNFILSI